MFLVGGRDNYICMGLIPPCAPLLDLPLHGHIFTALEEYLNNYSQHQYLKCQSHLLKQVITKVSPSSKTV